VVKSINVDISINGRQTLEIDLHTHTHTHTHIHTHTHSQLTFVQRYKSNSIGKENTLLIFLNL
jgi:hypothetical protein